MHIKSRDVFVNFECDRLEGWKKAGISYVEKNSQDHHNQVHNDPDLYKRSSIGRCR